MKSKTVWRGCALVFAALADLSLLSIGVVLLVAGVSAARDPTPAPLEGGGMALFFAGIVMAMLGSVLCCASAVMALILLGAVLASRWLATPGATR